MNKITVKVFSLLVALVLFAGIMAGCGSASKSGTETAAEVSTSAPEATSAEPAAEPAAEPEATGPDISKVVELQLYMVGDAPTDLQLVVDKLDEMTKKDLNCTVKFNYTTWTDFQTKYSLVLSSGQPVDLIYTAVWLNYQKLVNSGAFLALNDLLPTYAPELQKFVPEDLWQGVTKDGKIYAIPSTYREYMNNGVLYRKDIATKYSLPEPTNLDTLEQYLLGVKKNMPGQQLLQEFVTPGVQTYSFSAAEVLNMKYSNAYGPMYGLTAPYDNPKELQDYWGSQDFVDDMKMFKRWADEGLISRSALSDKTDATAFENGKTIATLNGLNIAKYTSAYTKSKLAHPDWKVAYAAFPVANGGKYWPNHATQNAYSIPTTSQNPERALMFYQKLVLDKTYNQLTEYGFEGTHYTVDADGYYNYVGDPTKSGFAKEGMNGWAWRNPEFLLWQKNDQVLKDMFAEAAKNAGPNKGEGFAEDYTAYSAERAALGTVMTQYLAPMQAGLVPDVDAAIKTFREKAAAAGLQKIQDAVKAQWAEYAASMGF